MPKVEVLPHSALCPEGVTIDVKTGDNLARALNDAGVRLQHACEYNGACATCHVIVRKGYESLEEPSDSEYDRLDQAFGSTGFSRLACRVKVGLEDLMIEIPVHNRNH